MEVTENQTIVKKRNTHPYQGEKCGTKRGKTRVREKEVIGCFHQVVKRDSRSKGDGECRELDGGKNIFLQEATLRKSIEMMNEELDGGGGRGRRGRSQGQSSCRLTNGNKRDNR